MWGQINGGSRTRRSVDYEFLLPKGYLWDVLQVCDRPVPLWTCAVLLEKVHFGPSPALYTIANFTKCHEIIFSSDSTQKNVLWFHNIPVVIAWGHGRKIGK